MIYIGFVAYVFQGNELHLEETAIIDMMKVVAPILPFLLVAAALTAQFSAAIADTSGSGGLVAELTGAGAQAKDGALCQPRRSRFHDRDSGHTGRGRLMHSIA